MQIKLKDEEAKTHNIMSNNNNNNNNKGKFGSKT